MPNIGEWVKGISFFLFVSLMFYFLWSTIFSGVLDFVAIDIFNIGASGETSIAIIKTAAWASFVLLYLSVGGIYLIYSFVSGAKGDIVTHPIEFLKAIGLWVFLTPLLTFVYGLVHFLHDSLSGTALLTGEMQTTATQFTWLFAVLMLVALVIVPFVFVLKGYGVDLWKTDVPKIG